MWYTLIIIIAAIALFVFLSMRGWSPIIGALICAAVVSFVAEGGFVENLFGTFISGMISVLGNFFLLFSFGTAFGGMLDATGASVKIGRAIIRILGEQNAIYAIMLVTVGIAMTGAVPIVQVAFIAIGIIKQAKIPRYIGMAACAGATSIAMSCMPGAMTTANNIAAGLLGTNLYAGPVLGLLTAVFGLILLGIYVRYLIKQAQRLNLGYDSLPNETETDASGEEQLPSFISAIIPVAVMLIGSFVCIIFFKMTSLHATVLADTVGILLLYALNKKYMKKTITQVLTERVNGIQWNVIGTTAVFGFATVITNTAVFQNLIEQFTEMSIHPYIIVVVATMIIACLCADNIGGVASFMGTIGTRLAAMGVNTQAIHRLSCIASGTLDSVPHAGFMILALSLFGYDHKRGFKYLFITNMVIPIIMTAFALVLAFIIY